MTQDQTHWWQRGVIYQIYPRRFLDSTGRIVLSSYLDREEPIDLALLRLRRDEGCVIELANL